MRSKSELIVNAKRERRYRKVAAAAAAAAAATLQRVSASSCAMIIDSRCFATLLRRCDQVCTPISDLPDAIQQEAEVFH